jgi:imidazolonepropionase-like amidohydrolase
VAGAQQPGPALVLPNVTIIDGTGTGPRSTMTLVVRDGLIAEMFPTGTRQPPQGARVLPVEGRFVTPGFIDTHVHLATTERPVTIVSSLLRATLLGGVTTVRDMGGNGAVVAALRDAAKVPGAASPEVVTAAVFAGPNAFWFTDRSRSGYLNGGQAPGTAPWLVRVDDGTNIRDAVRRAKAWGASGVKLHSHLTARQMRSIADEARRERLAIWSHATVVPAGPGAAVDARVHSMSHAETLVWQPDTGVPAAQFGTLAGISQAMTVVAADGEEVRALFTRMRERQIILEPTLYASVQASSFAGEERPTIDRQVIWAASAANLARQLGVTVVTGTDAIGGSSPNLHAELQFFVRRARFTPLQAIRAATLDAARAVGLGDVAGQIAVGRRADLVVLVRNPADDIRNTQTVTMVIRGGVVHERTDPMPVPPLAEAPGR